MKLTVIKIDPFREKLYIVNIDAPTHEVLHTNDGGVTGYWFQLMDESHPTHSLFVDDEATQGAGYSFANDPTIRYGFGMISGFESRGKKKSVSYTDVRYTVDEIENEITWHK